MHRRRGHRLDALDAAERRQPALRRDDSLASSALRPRLFGRSGSVWLRLKAARSARRETAEAAGWAGSTVRQRPSRPHVRPGPPAPPLLEVRRQQIEVVERDGFVPAKPDAAKLRRKHRRVADEDDRDGVGLQVETRDALDVVDGDALTRSRKVCSCSSGRP